MSVRDRYHSVLDVVKAQETCVTRSCCCWFFATNFLSLFQNSLGLHFSKLSNEFSWSSLNLFLVALILRLYSNFETINDNLLSMLCGSLVKFLRFFLNSLFANWRLLSNFCNLTYCELWLLVPFFKWRLSSPGCWCLFLNGDFHLLH